MMQAIGLRKSIGDVQAVAGVTFEVRPGEIFGLLGPNGAGKTTTIGCLCGLLTPTSGEVRLFGSAGGDGRRSLGVVPQDLALYEELSAAENLDYWGGVQGLRGAPLKERIQDVLQLTGLADRAREPVKRFSGGMKRRLNFGCGVVHQPKALLLDEPTVGIDPQSRVRLLELIRAQAEAGCAVLYTTHYMEEAETLCDRLAIIDHGRLMAQGTLAELRAMLGERDVVRLSGAFPVEACRAALLSFDGLEVLSASDSLLLLAVPAASARLAALLEAVSRAGGQIRGTTLTEPSLESLFIKLTGKELRE
jgi:ABC-2 type transport system ATP-binding protein